MGYTRVKYDWARKLLKAKYFVVLTDKDAAIMFDGVNTNDINDTMALAAQRSELAMFKDDLSDLIKRHDVAIKRVQGEQSASKKRKTTTTQGQRGKTQGKVPTKVHTTNNKKTKV